MSNTERLLVHKEKQIEGLTDDRDNLRDERNAARHRIAQLEAENTALIAQLREQTDRGQKLEFDLKASRTHAQEVLDALHGYRRFEETAAEAVTRMREELQSARIESEAK